MMSEDALTIEVAQPLSDGQVTYTYRYEGATRQLIGVALQATARPYTLILRDARLPYPQALIWIAAYQHLRTLVGGMAVETQNASGRWQGLAKEIRYR